MAIVKNVQWEAVRQKPMPCPFCKEANHVYLPEIEVYKHWVVCGACGAEGPKRQTKDKAISAWDGLSLTIAVANDAAVRESELLLHLHTLKSFALTLMNKYREIVVVRDSRRPYPSYDSRQDPILKRGYELIALTDGIETEVEDAG